MTSILSFASTAMLAAGVAATWISSAIPAQAQTSVLCYHNDASSTGQNLTETKLTPASVNFAGFGKIYAAAVDGQVYAQPLYVPGLTITTGTAAGTQRDTVFVCTEHDSVYALDATSGAQLWFHNAIDTAGGETTEPSSDAGTADINPEIGITGTPVIDATADPVSNKRYLYFVTKSRLVAGALPHYFFRVHAVEIASGVERPGSPVTIAETVHNADDSYTYVSGPSTAGDGSGSSDGRVIFNAMRQHQRAGLTLTGGKLYISFASHGDNGPYHGWILGYNAASFAPSAAFNVTPTGANGGIWMSGGTIVADATGALFVAVGNGSFASPGYDTEPVPADFDGNGFPANRNYGDALLKLVADGSTAGNPNPNGWGLRVADYFCPYNQSTLNSGDTDFGSGGVVLLPDSAGSAAHPHLLIVGSKEGRLYLIDRDNMGKFRGGLTGAGASAAFVSTGDAIVATSVPNAVFGALDTPAYFNGQFYFAGAYSGDRAKAFTVGNGTFNATPASQSPDTFGYLGSTPSVSASSATANGLVWCIDRGTNQLRAYDARNIASEVYTSGQAPNGRDLLGTAVKFGVATVADGRVFAGTSNTAGPSSLVCYGLFSPSTTPPAQPQNLYAQTVSGGEIDLFWRDFADNETSYEVYVSLDPNNFPATPRVTGDVDTVSAVINGLQVSTTYYFRVRAINGIGASAYSNIAATTSSVAPPVDFSNGFANAGTLLTATGFGSTPPLVGPLLRLTDLALNQGHSVWLNTSQNIGTFSSEFTFQLSKPDADGFTFAIQNAGPTAVGAYGGGLGYQNIATSVAVKFDLYPGCSTTGLYFNGAAPDDSTAPTANSSGSIDMITAGIDLHSGHVFRVNLTYDGSTLTEKVTDLTTRAVFTKAYTVNIASVIGSPKAYVGFTAGTGGNTAQQDIQTWSFNTALPVAPAAPTALTASAASATQINLAWTDNATNETSTRVERSTSGGAFAIIGSVGAGIAQYVDANLITNTTYKYRVVASNNGVDSTASNTVTMTTPVPPTTPSGAAPTFIAANEIDFSWNDNSNNETGYRVLRSADEADFSILALLPANSTSYKDTTANPSTNYDYHIQAYNAAGYVDFTGFNARTLDAVNIVAAVASTQEGSSNPGAFTIRRTVASEAALTVSYKISTGSGQAVYGTRYTLNPAPTTATTGTVTIPANGTAASILVNPMSDNIPQGTQNVTLTLTAGTGYSAVGSNAATVTILDTPLNSWKVSFFGVAAAQSALGADNADFDGDGLPNLVEYALGSNPLISSSSRVPQLSTTTVNGSVYLTLTYACLLPAPPDITYKPQSCTGLYTQNWQDAVLMDGYPQDLGNGYQLLRFRSATPTSSSNGGFMRLVVTKP